MDSVSQFALGAAIGVAVMGRRTSPLRAALWGGACGTLPDLDVLIDHGDPVGNMTLHRAETHAFVWQTLATPPIAAVLAALDRGGGSFRAALAGWLPAVWLILVTHALLDATTVYGTQLALPFSDRPFGLGSIFIIDPLYTLPLLAGLLGALVARGARRLRWNTAGLALSTLYLGWSAVAQAHVAGTVERELAARGAAPAERLLVTPTPFNTVLWRVLVMHADGYEEGFVSLLDGGRPVRLDRFDRHPRLREELRGHPPVERIAWFSRGFYAMREREGRVEIVDLRMGQEPHYSFAFAVATRASALRPTPPTAVGGRGDVGATLAWLRLRLMGADVAPPR